MGALNCWAARTGKRKSIERSVRKVVVRWVQQSLAHAWASWSSSANEVKKRRVLTKRIVMHWTSARLARAWETWSRHKSDEKRLKKAALTVLSRWSKQSMVASWNAWMARASMQKRLKTAAMKVIKRWTQQSMAVGWNTWSSAVRNEKRMRNVLQKVLARWHKSYLSAAWQTWSWSAAETVRIQALGRKVVARLQNQTAGVAFMRWLGKAGEEKKVRQVARKVVLRWESASKMKAFMRWEDAVAEAREEMTKSAEQASKEHEQLTIQNLKAADAASRAASATLLQNLAACVQDMKHAMKSKTTQLSQRTSALVNLSVELSSQFDKVTRDGQRANDFAAEIQKIKDDAENQRSRFLRKFSNTLHRRCTGRTLNAWACYACENTRMKRKARWSVGKWWRKRPKQIFHIWKQLVRAQLQLRTVHAQLMAHGTKRIISDVWGAWHFTWCKGKMKNRQLGNGVRRWKFSMLCKSVHTWQQHAAEKVMLRRVSLNVLRRWQCQVGYSVFLTPTFPPRK